MQEAQANLKTAAVEFLSAAESVARAAQTQADPLDEVTTDVLELGDLEPAISVAELADLKARLAQDPLSPTVILELVALARQAGAVLADMT
jgi:hypothetical protein